MRCHPGGRRSFQSPDWRSAAAPPRCSSRRPGSPGKARC
ncbi:MAG: hypothetical protein HQL51_05915 [Magnetococcales bacterium]|nr:hypothetical protein [Magnetococcales bacterium]